MSRARFQVISKAYDILWGKASSSGEPIEATRKVDKARHERNMMRKCFWQTQRLGEQFALANLHGIHKCIKKGSTAWAEFTFTHSLDNLYAGCLEHRHSDCAANLTTSVLSRTHGNQDVHINYV
ncbi:hypothetical protein M405DRAFT_121878 [Rhizopogon salebrosus TDB-379]|nr:hypothetical protein M405DRAFT_121878 [Rhizopogon salebrosus TDB-379]